MSINFVKHMLDYDQAGAPLTATKVAEFFISGLAYDATEFNYIKFSM